MRIVSQTSTGSRNRESEVNQWLLGQAANEPESTALVVIAVLYKTLQNSLLRLKMVCVSQ